MQKFRDRSEAGRVLALELEPYADRPGVLVLGLPRGGVPVAWEVAQALNAPLDVFTVRKIGVPGHEELALGAVATGNVRVLNEDLVDALGLAPDVINALARQTEQELARREAVYRGSQPAPDMRGKTVIIVDDGLATGATMRAAVLALRQQGAEQVVVAVPVAARSTCAALREEADDVVCAMTPEPFFAVGLWYENFRQTSDEEVRGVLARAQERGQRAA